MASTNFGRPRFAVSLHASTILVLALAISVSGETAARAADTIEVELLTEKGFPFDATRSWLDLFVGLGIKNIRINAAQIGDEVKVVTRGTEKSPTYHITGILAVDGSLHLSGGRFKLSDKRKIGDWLKSVAENGPMGEKKPKLAAFGLPEEKFTKLKGDLAQTVGFSTKGGRADEVVARIAAPLSHRLSIDSSAAKALAAGETVLDELSGVSCGSALAAAIRPAGLVLVPRQTGDEIELIITSSKGAKEIWPVGWASETAPAKLLPETIKAINVDIEEDTELTTMLKILADKVNAPMVFDHNNNARKGIDLASAKVSLPPERLTYSNVLRKVLYQANLKYEIRVDEADKPFLWISPLR
jgi:hypothetical protein